MFATKDQPKHDVQRKAVQPIVVPDKPTDSQGLLDVGSLNQNKDLLVERRQTRTRRNPFAGHQ
ncbi:MAG: hypothetical protein RL211_917 [Pseudomonadota bacterium]|jgi:hypothetical protein